MGLSKLHLTEEQFWKMSPRKFDALLRAYSYMYSTDDGKSKSEFGYIDNLVGW